MSTDCRANPATTVSELARCLDCRAALHGRDSCPGCGRAFSKEDGILEAIGALEGRNRTVAAFYDGPGWGKFRKWERLFLAFQGGSRRARMSILQYLIAFDRPAAKVLEVGIGDGENLRFLPDSWKVYGVDIARTQLVACTRRFPSMVGRLAWAQAEQLPFPDATFDACFSIGGFTYFNEHATALSEIRRVTHAGGPVVVADENPGIQRAGLGHLIGLPAIDKLWLRQLGLDPGFIDMVLSFDLDLPAVTARTWPSASRFSIWSGLGYCLVDPSPSAISRTFPVAQSRTIS